MKSKSSKIKKQTIQVNLQSGKEELFYQLLAKTKMYDLYEIEDYKALINAIDFKKEIYSNFMSSFENPEQSIDKKLKSIYDYLSGSEKYSKDYLLVSTNSFDSFLESKFGLHLKSSISLIEKVKEISGEEESIEVKSALSIISMGFNMFGTKVGEALAEGLSHALNKALKVKRIKSAKLAVDIENNKKSAPLEIGYINEPIDDQNTANTNSGLSLFQATENDLKIFLRTPVNSREALGLRNKITIYVYSLLKQYYPNIGSNVLNVITGYTCATLGYLDTKQVYEKSERNVSYRKYLTNSVNNIINTKP